MRRTNTPADAEDVAAETFTIAWRKLDAVPRGEPLPWLYAVARRVLANQRRGLGRRERLASLLRVRGVATPMRAGEPGSTPAFAALGSRRRRSGECSGSSRGRGSATRRSPLVLGITPNAVAIRLHRARARFAEALARVTSMRTT